MELMNNRTTETFDRLKAVCYNCNTKYYNLLHPMRQILNISLPIDMVKDVRKAVKQERFSSVSEFIRHLIRLYNTRKLATELEKDSKAFREGKLDVIEIKSSLKELLEP